MKSQTWASLSESELFQETSAAGHFHLGVRMGVPSHRELQRGLDQFCFSCAASPGGSRVDSEC